MLNHRETARLTQMASAMAVILGGLTLMPAAHAAAPAAGTNISNIARATYNDGNGNSRSVDSNEVQTTVLQVASFTLVQNQTVSSNPNGQVKLYHTLTNTGNGTDSFTLSVANVANLPASGGDDFDFSGIQIFALDASGNPTGPNLATSGNTLTLTAGQAANLVVITTTPATAANGNKGQITVGAASTFTPAVTATNTDTVNVTGNGVITVTKSATYNPVTRRVDYTLTVQNIGNSTATAININDVLDSRLTYVTGSAKLSGTGLTDADNAPIDKYTYTAGTKTVTMTIDSMAPNTTSTLTFSADVVTGTAAGTIPNKAAFNYDPDGNGGTPPTSDQDTNTATVTIAANILGTINDSETNAFSDSNIPTPLSTATDDIVEVANANPGSTSSFDTWVHNTGNATETYNVTSALQTLPAGTIVTLYKADGVTLLTDTDGDGVVDTGPVAPGSAIKVVAKVTLPSNVASTSGQENWTARLTLTPVNNPTATDTVTLRVVDVSVNTVDLLGLNETTSDGASGATVIDTKITTPGTQTTFVLKVANEGGAPDNYNLSATNVPAGWTVTFVENTGTSAAPVCGTTPVTNTGTIASGSSKLYCALVTPANNATAGNTDLTFTVTSPVTSKTDSLVDRVTISTVNNLALTPDRTGQVAPGGTIVYSHLITNNGNTDETSLPFTLTTNPGVTSQEVYFDANKNGQIDAGDTLITGNNLNTVLSDGKLAPGETEYLLVKLQVPASATAGTTYNTILTVTPPVGSAVTATDVTTVNVGQVRLVKLQGLDANCDGDLNDTDDLSLRATNISAKPGACIVYDITATNEGNQAVTNLVISDTVPTYTTMVADSTTNGGTTGTVSPASGSAATASNNVGTLAPLSSAKLVFSVKVDQ